MGSFCKLNQAEKGFYRQRDHFVNYQAKRAKMGKWAILFCLEILLSKKSLRSEVIWLLNCTLLLKQTQFLSLVGRYFHLLHHNPLKSFYVFLTFTFWEAFEEPLEISCPSVLVSWLLSTQHTKLPLCFSELASFKELPSRLCYLASDWSSFNE